MTENTTPTEAEEADFIDDNEVVTLDAKGLVAEVCGAADISLVSAVMVLEHLQWLDALQPWAAALLDDGEVTVWA